MNKEMKNPYQTWMIEGGVIYPIPGSTMLYNTPGGGVFQMLFNSQMGKIGLQKISDEFTFDFKMYDVGCGDMLEHIQDFWNNEQTRKTQKNLGVIFNGIKGTGKTIAAKLLCNQIGLPVIIVSYPIAGMLEFIQNLDFECVVLIDEAEKTFKNNNDEVLLKLIDGVYNRKRKLYILTTNKLYIDDNLIGRPGRIRYIKEFGNLSIEVVNAYLDDNLQKPECREDIRRLVDSLDISTIDILKSIVEEANVFGHVDTETTLNLPQRLYEIDCLAFTDITPEQEKEIRAYVASRKTKNIHVWLEEAAPARHATSTFNGGMTYSNILYLQDVAIFDECDLETRDERLRRGSWTDEGIVIKSLDRDGFVVVEHTLTHERTLFLVRRLPETSSLYKIR